MRRSQLAPALWWLLLGSTEDEKFLVSTPYSLSGDSFSDVEVVFSGSADTRFSRADLGLGPVAHLQVSTRMLRTWIDAAFAMASEEVFEDGMSSVFSRRIVALVEKYGDAAVDQLSDVLGSGEANEETFAEALRWLGRIEHASTHASRMSLLVRSLTCPSARVRDGAALGLAFLDDRGAAPHLRAAIRVEPNRQLREDMVQVLDQLESS